MSDVDDTITAECIETALSIHEPEWLLEWRLAAFRHFLRLLAEGEAAYPQWAHLKYRLPDFQAISYYSAPRQRPALSSLRVDRETLGARGVELLLGLQNRPAAQVVVPTQLVIRESSAGATVASA